MKLPLSLLGLLLCLGAGPLPCSLLAQEKPTVAAKAEASPEEVALDKKFAAADKAFDEKNWADARDAYDKLRQSETDWGSATARRAVDGAVASLVKLELWDDAFARAKELVEHTKGTFEEARARRFLGGLYLTSPHFGTKQGGKFLRGKYGQGVYVTSWKKDKREGVTQYEQARDLLAGFLAKPETDPGHAAPNRQVQVTQELIGLDFDLSTALSQQDDSDYYGAARWGFCFWWWPAAWEDEEDSEALEEADYEEPRYGRGWGGYGQEDEALPTGLPTGPDGKPRFMSIPSQYTAKLGQGPKIRYLLEEIQRLDTTEKKDDAGRALYRWGQITAMLYGPSIVNNLTTRNIRYDRWGHPLPAKEDPDAPKTKLWELSDDQALALAGGKVRVVDLPAAESPLSIWCEIEKRYPESSSRRDALHSIAQYYQGRQQFGKAVEAYETVIKFRPSDDNSAFQSQIDLIRKPEVMLSENTVQLPGGKPRLDFDHRNLGTVQFKAIRFDMVRMVRDELENDHENGYWNFSSYQYRIFQDGKERWKKYTGKTEATWTETITPEPDFRAGKGYTLAPLSAPGAYLIEATGEGVDNVSRVLVLVTDITIVQKNLTNRGLIYICDANTGQPLADKAVRIYEHWTTYPPQGGNATPHYDSDTLKTNKDGVIEYKRKRNDGGSQVEAVVLGEDGRMAFTFFQNWYEHTPENGWEDGRRIYVVTDRPVYRPGETMQFRAWIRDVERRVFAKPVAGQTVNVEILDARNNSVEKFNCTTDAQGGISGQCKLGDEPPLGVYHLTISNQNPDSLRMAGGIFRVEEYKKPEFEVTVKPSTTQAHLGDKFKATISARYYFGQPVASGSINYKVFREDYRHVYFEPGEYDWLYGIGYGHYAYAYPWFPWWGRWGCVIWDRFAPWAYVSPSWNFPWGFYGDYSQQQGRNWETTTRKALRELVAQGTATLKPDGTYEVEIDSAPAARDLPNTDHRYTIEAEVRDASRRTITGEGSVVATRQSFYAFVETDNGWYRDTGDVRVKVRTLSPDNVPVAAQGEVIVYRITYPDGEVQPKEEVVKRWPAETDPEGRLSFSYALPGGGQYRIAFTTQDAWEGEVQGNAIVWARGPEFDGREYRFNNLEVIADKRSYKVGDVAHLLVNCAETGSRVLYSDNVSQGVLLDYRFIDVPGRSTVVDIPIEDRHVPNFFVEATIVRHGEVFTENRELFVPPVKGLLDLKVTTDKAEYRAGDKGHVRIEGKDYLGQPASGEVALTVYDEAVTYIQDEFGPSPRAFYYGQKRWHQPFLESSTAERFTATGYFNRPDQSVLYYFTSGMQSWGLETEGLGLSLQDNLESSLSSRGQLRRRDFKSKSVAKFAKEEMREAGSGMLAADASATTAVPASAPMEQAANGTAGFFGGAALKDMGNKKPGQAGGDGPALVEPEIRMNFADTAFWGPTLKFDANGVAETDLTFPQSLTSWRVHGYAMTAGTQVGDAVAKATTSKKLIVRLQAPRFFMERDEVVLSANVNNYLPTAQKVRAEITLPDKLLRCAEIDGLPKLDADGNRTFVQEHEVSANGEYRFDWPVVVVAPGLATITVKALTAEESDGMRMAFPALVHGINKTVAQSGAYRVAQEGVRTLKVDLPEAIDPEQTQLEVKLSPSLAGVMFDALPYLTGYPYGCVEQTMSRFYPSVLVRDTLKKMGTDLEKVGERRRQMNQAGLNKRFEGIDPVFDSKELDKMIAAGLERIYNFQQADGGWGWWSEDKSDPYQTSYVLQGLRAAREADVKVDDGIYQRGMQFLKNHLDSELAKPEKKRQLGSIQTQAYLAYILTLEKDQLDDEGKKWLTKLYEHREELNNYGRALLALAMHQQAREEEAKLLLTNLLQFVDRDDSNETAWARTPQDDWWYWWNNDIETNAWALKALVAIDPKNDLAPRIVKWLLNNRANGYYWRSTRDTAQVISAMTAYMRASGEDKPDYKLMASIDGQPSQEFTVKPDDVLTFDGKVALYGLQLKPGPHEITLTKTGPGALYYSAYLSYFTKEEDVKGAGNEVFVNREYFKLVPKTEEVRLPDAGAANTQPAGQSTALEETGRTELRAGFTRIPLKSGDWVTSGDQIEVVLKITAKNTYDYLAFEDMKPAGCEPVELRSGGRWAGGLCANLELRDEKVVFFIGLLEQGEHILKYKLRAETPGKFHAMPASAFAMYAPEIKAISDEMRLEIKE